MSDPATSDTEAVAPIRRHRQLRDEASRFRILIVGRANAGNTSILRKIGGTTDDPEVHTKDGHKISAEIFKHGLHDIEDTILFKSRPGFMFHYSGGFELGRDDELKKVNDFVLARSKAKTLYNQLHAIWYCIPMDDDHPITHTENQFFSYVGTGNVIVVFTKCEALEVKAITTLEAQGYDLAKAIEKAPEYVQNELKNTYLDLQKKIYPPWDYVCLNELNKLDQHCRDLVEHTVTILDDNLLQTLFISAQQNSVEGALKSSFKWALEKSWGSKAGEISHGNLLKHVASYFPYYVSFLWKYLRPANDHYS